MTDCESCDANRRGIYDFKCMRCMARHYHAILLNDDQRRARRQQLLDALGKEQFAEFCRHVEELEPVTNGR